MDTSTNLALPYIAAAQAQKHVTHNEAIRALDAIVHLSVLDRSLAAPPAAPADGARYIVAAAASGAWSGQSGRIAAFQDGAWAFYAPQAGWRAWVVAEALLVVYGGVAWLLAGPATTGAPIWGINATADATNRLAVAAPATLLNHAGAGHQLKLNKATATDTASLLLQDNFSGRAEIGLTGDDNLHVKVSADGAVWKEALVFDRATGNADFKAKVSLSATVMLLLANQTDFVGTQYFGSAGAPALTRSGTDADGIATHNGRYNTIVGHTAGISLTTGNYNVGLGVEALFNATTAVRNTALGEAAGFGILNGKDNVAIGWKALLGTGGASVTGSNNIAIGSRALGAGALSGANNIGIGGYAGASTTTGSDNVAVGAIAFYSATSGNGNAAFGKGAAFSTTSGGFNVALGNDALFSNTTGFYNLAIASNAARLHQTGDGNVAIGFSALYSDVNGTANTAIGQTALYDQTGALNNTAVGANTGRGITTGSGNTIIGANVTGLAAALTGNVIIADGNGNRRINIDSAGNTGIGTATPTTKLDVAGPVRVGQYAKAALPVAATVGAGAMAYVSDDVGGAVIAFSDGTVWRRVTDRAVVS